MRRMRRGKRNQKKGSLIGFVLIFLIGAGILFYPTMSYWLAQRNHIVAHQTYERNVAELSAQEKRTMWEVAVHYNERLLNSVVEDPFASTENIDPFDEYYQTLDVGDGVMGYIHIPELEVLLPIYHGVSEEVLDKGVGHIHASALPVGGEGTHAVLTGHTGLSNAKMFNDLVEMRQGDEFYLEILDETLAYEVTSIQVVLPDDVSSLHREDGKDKVTLVTCTPYGVNSHRLLVSGERIPYTGEMQQSREGDKGRFLWWILVVVLLVVSVVLVMGKKVRERSEERKGIKRRANADMRRMRTEQIDK